MVKMADGPRLSPGLSALLLNCIVEVKAWMPAFAGMTGVGGWGKGQIGWRHFLTLANLLDDFEADIVAIRGGPI
jgi:hypothetical protein